MIGHAPLAPGRLGERIDPAALGTYLTELDTWVRERRRDLDDVDNAALAAGDNAALTGDILLSMALWKAVADRQRLLVATWDGGRVGDVERERLSTLIWGRLDATLDAATAKAARSAAGGANLALSVPEACRLSDALLGQLRVRLHLDPAADEHARRVKDLRAQLERLRDQIALEPAPAQPAASKLWDRLRTRVDEVTTKAQRGGDVGGLLGPLENDAARFERDLIVGGAKRRDAADEIRSLTELRDDLEAREAALSDLAATVSRTLMPAPRYAVPDVSLLGPVPSAPEELPAYKKRLERVTAAMNLVSETCTAALAAHEDLVARLATVQARERGRPTPGLAELVAVTATVLDTRPTRIAVAEHLIAACEAWPVPAEKESA